VTGFDDDYGEDAPERDLAAQLAQAQAERKAAEEKLSALQRRHSEARPPSPVDGQASGGPGGADLDELMALLNDRSRSWPDVLADLEQRGFRSTVPQPSRHGIRQA
jgi:hypothetical protein